MVETGNDKISSPFSTISSVHTNESHLCFFSSFFLTRGNKDNFVLVGIIWTSFPSNFLRKICGLNKVRTIQAYSHDTKARSEF